MHIIRCCKDCTERHLACHADCKKYLSEKAKRDKDRELAFISRLRAVQDSNYRKRVIKNMKTRKRG